MPSGWIKIHRRMWDKAYSNRPDYMTLWLYLLMHANHKPKEFMWNNKIIQIGKGMLVTGRHELSKRTGVKPIQCYKILNFFEKEGQIEQQKSTKYTIVKILNWNKYQVMEQQRNNRGTTEEQQRNTNKNVKNVKNEKNREGHALTPVEINKFFFEGKEPYHSMRQEFLQRGVPENILDRELTKFVAYWTEKNKSGTRERWEMQATFDVKRRLSFWLSRVGNFERSNITKGKKIIGLDKIL